MRDILDVKGASGAVYRFTRFRDGNPLSAMGGNFVYAREENGEMVVLYAGEVQNLLLGARAYWDQAVRDHSAEALFTRLNISEAVRRREHSDIAEGRSLPMKLAPVAEGPD